MTDLNDALRRLSQRGTPRGASRVYADAREDAQWRPTPRRVAQVRRAAIVAAAAIIAVVLLGAVLIGTAFRDGEDTIEVGLPRGSNVGPTPTFGGAVTFGLDAAPAGGFCLPRAQLDSGGLQVVAALYDTLVVPVVEDRTTRLTPSLATAVEHDATYTTWTITLPDGVSFHDGEPLTADAVVQNLEAYRAGPLFGVVLDQVASVTARDARTVVVTTKVPWVAFDAFLWSGGRLGIVAPAQLAHEATCATTPIGTGPFRWAGSNGSDITVDRNPHYWQHDVDGRTLPYLDRIVFRSVPNASDPTDELEHGDLELIQTSDPSQIARLRRDANARSVFLTETDRDTGVSHVMLNASAPPFDDRDARLALAEAVDWDTIIARTQAGVVRRASQPFSEGSPGYVGPGALNPARHDLDDARRHVRSYEERVGHPLEFQLFAPGRGGADVAALVKSQAEAAGMHVDIVEADIAQTTNQLIAGTYAAVLWQNYAGHDPDLQRAWWVSTTAAGAANILNFGKLHDAEIDALIRQGRSETDPEQRVRDYQDLTRRFVEENYNLWGWYTRWAFAAKPNVHGNARPYDNGTVRVSELWRER